MKRNILILLTVLLMTSCAKEEQQAKYIFYFIGDGMGFSHVSISESYLHYLNTGEIGNENLSFTGFPVLGMASTYSASNNITCSSAAGTALSTGSKTNNGFLGVTPDTSEVTSIAKHLHNSGYRIGIASSVNINHATPASFYGHCADRNDYYTLAKQLCESGYEFFGGGGFLDPQGKDGNEASAYTLAQEKGYRLLYGYDATPLTEGEKVLLLQKKEKRDLDLPSPGERGAEDLTLPQVVKKGIEVLTQEDAPFFFMVEGGKIDWFAHANNPKATIEEVLDFSDAVAIAVEFYNKHPEETLIVVTADHETGGFAMGRKGYSVDFSALKRVADEFSGSNGKTYENQAEQQRELLKTTNAESRLGWTTTGHSGVNVPVFAIGAGSEAFAGKMDNTDIPVRILNNAILQ